MERKKNILLLNSTLHIGGAETVIATLARKLDRSRFNIFIGLLKEQGTVAERLIAEGFDVFLLRNPKKGKVDYLSFLELRSFIKSRHIDLVHTHDLHSLLDGCLCRLTFLSFKLVHTFHFGNYPFRRERYLFLERIFWRVPDCLVAVGNVQKQSLMTTFDIPDKTIRTIWNGVGLAMQAEFSLDVGKYGTTNTVLIGSISTLIEQKGLTYLLEAAAELKKRCNNFVVLIAGEGYLRRELEEKSRLLGLDEHVQFLGWVKDAASTLIPQIDIFVQSSLWEGMSMVVLEAMAQGKPVVATVVGENPFVVKDEITGFLVEPADVLGMVDALEKLVKDRALRTECGRIGKEHWSRKFNADAMTRGYSDMYNDLLGGSAV